MVRNIIGVIVGLVAGNLVNFALIMVNMAAWMPPGTDFSTPDGVNAAMANLQPVNFAMVFLAHALGTLIAAFLAVRIAVSQKLPIASIIGMFFLLGGVYAAAMIDAPVWFEVADLLLAYIPMAWLGATLGGSGRQA